LSREQSLQAFVDYCDKYNSLGDERGEAQIFLDRLFVAFGYPDGIKEAHGTAEKRIKFTLDEHSTTRFADLVIPGRVLIEMKKRDTDLQKAQLQALDYWKYLTPHPDYVVTCNFDEFWVYDMEKQVDYPIDKIKLSELASQWGALAFLFPVPETPVFSGKFDLVDLTHNAAENLSDVFKSLTRTGRFTGEVQAEHARQFILQCMIALFAEDIGLLPRYTFTRILDESAQNLDHSPALFTSLFFAMNSSDPKGGIYQSIPYFNGGLFDFRRIHMLQLLKEEIRLLRECANSNWASIRPAIFGAIFEKSLKENTRHAEGIHFTSEGDILRIIDPVIERPWLERIHAAVTQEQLSQLHEELCNYRVLDPACGSGNFLYMAYRTVKRLEQRILERLEGMLPEKRVSVKQFYGIDLNPFAVELARVTLMIAKKIAADEGHSGEPALPLDNLDANIICADALFTEWANFDACVGNPPYLGAKLMKPALGAEYVERLRAAFPTVDGNADYAVYWLNKAHNLMKPGTRTGLVATNSIRQNKSRESGLDIIVREGGTIFEAYSSVPWTGEAKVHVSIVCWSKGESPFATQKLYVNDRLTFIEVPLINSGLSPELDVTKARVLSCNTEPQRVFQGQTPGHDGFVLKPAEATAFIRKDQTNREVIFPYLTGDDLLGAPNGKPRRYIIDFGVRDILDAQRYRAAFERVEAAVLPDKQAKADEEARKNRDLLAKNPRAKGNRDHEAALKQWWLHFRSRQERRNAVQGMARYIACSRVTKRPIFDFVSSAICPSDALQTFAFDDDYTFGILQSNAHGLWFKVKASSLKSDPRYTPSSVFNTFPFPQAPTQEQVKRVADAGRTLHEFRHERMSRDGQLTLRDLYAKIDKSGTHPLKDLHAALDQAVMAAYGFASETSLLAGLLALNGQVTKRMASSLPVTAPGIPGNYPNPQELISSGCIQPHTLI